MICAPRSRWSCGVTAFARTWLGSRSPLACQASKGWSGLRESNPSDWLGKPGHYHYAKPAPRTPHYLMVNGRSQPLCPSVPLCPRSPGPCESRRAPQGPGTGTRSAGGVADPGTAVAARHRRGCGIIGAFRGRKRRPERLPGACGRVACGLSSENGGCVASRPREHFLSCTARSRSPGYVLFWEALLGRPSIFRGLPGGKSR